MHVKGFKFGRFRVWGCGGAGVERLQESGIQGRGVIVYGRKLCK